VVRDSWFVKVTPLTGRHFYMGAVHRLGEKLVLYINRVNIDAGRVRTYKSLWIQVNPCVPPASGRVPKGQEGRTMVRMKSDWKVFMRNVMIFTFQAVTMD